MDTRLIKKHKWFWAWQDEKEEAWLSEMSRQGFHLEKIPFPATYLFRNGEPADYVYRLDFQSLRSRDRESYLQLFADAGWEHAGDMGGWVYFRIRARPGEAPEIYSDTESKKGKYQRLLTYLIIFLPILIVASSTAVDQAGPFFFILEGLYAILMLLYVLAMVNLLRRISQLQTGKKKQ